MIFGMTKHYHTISLTENEHIKLREICRAHNIRMTKFIRDCLIEKLNEGESRLTAKRLFDTLREVCGDDLQHNC